MDSFTFTVQTGPVAVFFHETITIPVLPRSGGIYVADENTLPLLQKAKNFDSSMPLVVLAPGEEEKQLSSVERILEAALNAGLARDSVFVGFGGGVVTDMTAFAASLYMRGAGLCLVPTTLLAMADAAVGGKTGVDFGNFKNCVGTFYPAQEIHISVDALRTLPQTEFMSGLAEVVKTAMLYAPKLYQILWEKKESILSRDGDLLLEIVKRCVQAKAHVVERDLKETGERMFLNLGHTFAHALETVAGLGTISHGEAVAWGIARALELGKRAGITDLDWAKEATGLIASYGYSIAPVHPVLAGRNEAETPQLLLNAMKNDKKKKGGVVRFVLQREINSTLVTPVPDAEVLAVLA